MDLAAAVSNPDASIPQSGDYLVQFTNQGEYVFDKTTGLNTASIGQWDFWCNGTNLPGCSANAASHPFDTQISYNAYNGNWIVAALSYDGITKGAYLYVGASKTADPSGLFNLYALSPCTMYSNPSGGSGYPYDLGDNPIMGISHAYNGTKGRVVVDLPCWSTDTQGTLQNYQADEIFDIDISVLEVGGSLGGGTSCGGSSCRTFSNAPGAPGNTLQPFLRPANNYGTYNEIILNSVALNASGQPELYLYKITPGTSVTNDLFGQFDPRNPSSPAPFVAPTTVYSQPGASQALAPQPGCSVSSNCAIRTDTLHADNSAIQTNANGRDIFTTSFSALAPDQTDSYYFAFVLNQHNGTFKFVSPPVTTNGIIGFTGATLDPDQEVAVNYTTFTSSGSSTAVDLINANPISSTSVVSTNPSVASSSSALPSYSCTANTNPPACRWGDYTAEIYDPSCDAVSAAKQPECGLFWSTVEWTDGTNLNSQLVAVDDPVEPNDTGTITFVGSNNAETECSASPCSITFAAPAGTQAGDVLLVAMSATQATGWVPSPPSGWTALTFRNQGGNPNFASADSSGNEESAWLLVHVYGSSDSGSYTFSEQTLGAGTEIGGLILDYRGVDTTSLDFSAWGFGSTADSATVTVGQKAAPAYNQLIAVFKTAADDANGSENGSGVAYSTNSWSPPLTAETTMTITGDAWTGFAADRWTYNGGTFGPYSVTANYSGLPLGWLVLLPSGLQ